MMSTDMEKITSVKDVKDDFIQGRNMAIVIGTPAMGS